MKIAVNGNYIETKDIYQISEIEEYRMERNVYFFNIISFNQNTLTVEIDKNGQRNIIRPPEFENWKKLAPKIPEINKMRLELMRQEIIKIWSENQPTIPMINLTSYIDAYTIQIDES